jgi:hypothetical protein
VKAALVGLLLFAVARPDLTAVRGQGDDRAGAALPARGADRAVRGWVRGRRDDYPYALDILLVLPFLIDVAGNALNLYDTVDWWDDANHFVN